MEAAEKVVTDSDTEDEEGTSDDADRTIPLEVRTPKTPKKVVEIDLTASPANKHSSPPGANHGCSVCLDSLRDIR